MNVAQQFFRAPAQTGALTAASNILAEKMVASVPLKRCTTVVEFGPGTGVVTQAIVRSMTNNSRFFAMELNPYFAQKTRNRCPGVDVIEDNACKLRLYLDQRDILYCDAIISSLPWTLFDLNLQRELLNVVETCLPTGGTFVTYTYAGTRLHPAGKRFIQLLKEYFPHQQRHLVWNNLPPAYIYTCRK